jgi:two-component system sensor histidine kinase TctE
MLQESILNVLYNSLLNGGQQLSEIQVSLTASDKCLILTLADDGVGISVDKHIQALSRFSQADAGRGSGLGLPIAAKVIDAHNGNLEIKQRTTGAKIEITLPLLSC